MPPNLKPASVPGQADSGENPGHEEDIIRTDFVLQNIFCHSLRKVYAFEAVCAINDKEKYVLKELKEIVDDFLINFGDEIKGLCLEIEISEDTIASVIQGVSNELFSAGITWSNIISLFAFIGELTLLCLARKFPDRIVNGIYDCFCAFVKENLDSWVEDHGGWEGLTVLSEPQQGNRNSICSWIRRIFYRIFQVIGILAEISNATNNVIP